MSLERRQQLIALAQQTGAYILEDDYELNVQFHQAMRECIFCFAVANYEEKLSFEEWQKNN